MTTMTIAPATTGPGDSFNTGYGDGELAAFTGLPESRAAARIAMAEQYDPMYAQGYADGYLYGADTLAASEIVR